MDIRPARLDDVEGIVSLVPSLGPVAADIVAARVPPRPGVRGDHLPAMVVAASDDGVGGVLIIDTASGAGRLRRLVVAPDRRRHGHGRRLLVCGERMLARLGYPAAHLAPEPGDETEADTIEPFLVAAGWAAASTPAGEGWSIELGDDGAVRSSLVANRWQWDENAPSYEPPGRRAFAPEGRVKPSWGCWGVPEAEVGMLRNVAGADVVELGCGTGYVSAYCLAAGAASAVGIDNSPAQLATARALQAEFDLPFPLLFGDAARTPFADASFDVAISEYGAAIWCDPYAWIPEAARLLRPGGHLAFLGNSVAAMLAVREFEAEGPAEANLVRPQRGMHRFAWFDNLGVEFHISHGDMIRLLRDSGFEVEDLIELYIPEGAPSNYTFVDHGWGARWPVEEVWLARKR
ncbi:MAG: class I SAM-dependent methyltransferase [Actinomycetota bacterium]